MRIEVEAKLILTVSSPRKEDFAGAGDIVLAAEHHINNGTAAVFDMPETKTKVGIRIHTLGIPRVIQ